MAVVDIVIELLKINCGVVQCSGYASDIEALFYLVFFPMVFIFLLVYVVSGVILERTGGTQGALRILIGAAMLLFIIFQGYYTFFVSLSKLWWILVVGLVGLYIFIHRMIHGGGGPVGGHYKSATSRGVPNWNISGKAKDILRGEVKKKRKAIVQTMKQLRGIVNDIENVRKNPTNYPGTNLSDLSREYNDIKRTILDFIDNIDEYGKVNTANTDWQLVRLGEKYEKELEELDKRVEGG
jgi:hypothetical protein